MASLLEQLAHSTGHPLRVCPEITAACLEVLNIIAGLLPGYSVPALFATPSRRALPSAFLDLQISLLVTHQTAERHDVSRLRAYLAGLLDRGSINTACAVLEEMPAIWHQVLMGSDRVEVGSELRTCYAEIVRRTTSPTPRSQALLNYASLLDEVLAGEGRRAEGAGDLRLPSYGELIRLWESVISCGEINPVLACAVLRASGPIMATLDHHLRGGKENGDGQKGHRQRLRAWGAMMMEALDVDSVRPCDSMTLTGALVPLMLPLNDESQESGITRRLTSFSFYHRCSIYASRLLLP